MYQVYHQSVHQTKIANKLTKKFLHYGVPKISKKRIVLNQELRPKRSIGFPKENFIRGGFKK